MRRLGFLIGLFILTHAVMAGSAWAGEAPSDSPAPAPSDSPAPAPSDSPAPAPETTAPAENADPAAAPAPAPAGKSGALKGQLRERGTRTPLGGLTVYLKLGEEIRSTETDEKGFFEFADLPVGTYTVNVPSLDYEAFETQEEIVPGEATEVVYYLEPKVYGGLQVVVRGRKVKKEVSRKVLKMEEARVIPGSQGDPVKVVENLPGVAEGSSSMAGIVIRGSNAEDSRILLDGHSIPLLFHFGGYKSVYNADFLNEINLYQGGFGTEYGFATGGIVELKTRKPRTDRWGGYVDTSFSDATIFLEGPASSNVGLGFAFRRSTIDLVLPFVFKNNDKFSLTVMPVYYDYQFKFDWQANKEHSLSLDWFGALDKFEFVSNQVGDSEPEISGKIGMQLMFHLLTAHYRYKKGPVENDFSPSFGYIGLKFYVGKDFYFTNNIFYGEIRDDLSIRISETQTLNFGFEFNPGYASVKSNLTRPPKEGDVAYSFSNSEKIYARAQEWDASIALYANHQVEIKPFTFTPGVRFEFNRFLNQYAIDPRLNARCQVLEPLAFKAAVGLYHRIPDPDEVFAPFGNTGLLFERALHVVGGLEWSITDTISLDVQGYYKHLDLLVSRTTSEKDAAAGRIYENKGKGYVYGAEVLLRHSMTEHFFGWISYSYSRSMRTDGPGQPYRLFDMDQTHNLVVVASYRFLKTWQIGGRFQYASGNPYTEITGSIQNSDNGTYIPLYGKQNGERSRGFHRLDVRLDKTWVFNTWMLHTYLDVQGVYYHANTMGVVYNYDYSEKQDMTDLPILPSIGLKFEF